jgi:hypothetical protein
VCFDQSLMVSFTTKNFDPSKCTCIGPLGKGLHTRVNNSIFVTSRMFGVANLILYLSLP